MRRKEEDHEHLQKMTALLHDNKMEEQKKEENYVQNVEKININFNLEKKNLIYNNEQSIEKYRTRIIDLEAQMNQLVNEKIQISEMLADRTNNIDVITENYQTAMQEKDVNLRESQENSIRNKQETKEKETLEFKRR